MARGVSFLPGSVAERFLVGDDGKSVSAVELGSGEILPCSFVICCIGATIPRDLFEEQLEIQGRGLKVDSHMRTSLSHVYAAGDLCSFMVKRSGRFEVMEHVKHA